MADDTIPVPRQQLERWAKAVRATRNLAPRDSERLDQLHQEMEERLAVEESTDG